MQSILLFCLSPCPLPLPVRRLLACSVCIWLELCAFAVPAIVICTCVLDLCFRKQDSGQGQLDHCPYPHSCPSRHCGKEETWRHSHSRPHTSRSATCLLLVCMLPNLHVHAALFACHSTSTWLCCSFVCRTTSTCPCCIGFAGRRHVYFGMLLKL